VVSVEKWKAIAIECPACAEWSNCESDEALAA
jgi:hypothetical protein